MVLQYGVTLIVFLYVYLLLQCKNYTGYKRFSIVTFDNIFDKLLSMRNRFNVKQCFTGKGSVYYSLIENFKL